MGHAEGLVRDWARVGEATLGPIYAHSQRQQYGPKFVAGGADRELFGGLQTAVQYLVGGRVVTELLVQTSQLRRYLGSVLP